VRRRLRGEAGGVGERWGVERPRPAHPDNIPTALCGISTNMATPSKRRSARGGTQAQMISYRSVDINIQVRFEEEAM